MTDNPIVPVYVSQWGPGADRRQNDCGPACVAEFTRATGDQTTVDQLPTADPTGLTDAPELVKLLAAHGLTAHIEYSDPALPLAQAIKPYSILLINYDPIRAYAQDVRFTGWHWLVYEGPDPVNSTNSIVNDPDYWGARINEGDHKSYPTAALRSAFRRYSSKVGACAVVVDRAAATVPIPVYTPTIIDLSHWNNVVNDALLKDEIAAGHITAIFHKAWEYGPDGAYKGRQVEYGSLVEFVPICFGVGDVDPVKQCNDFLAFAQPQRRVVIYDKEGNPDGPSATDVQAEIWQAHAESLNYVVITYSNLNQWRDSGSGPKHNPLWISSQQEPPPIPPQWSTWTFQQFEQVTIPGVDGVTDHNQFNGSAAQLAAFWSAIPLAASSSPIKAHVTADLLFAHTGPTMASSHTGAGYKKGAAVTYDENSVHSDSGYHFVLTSDAVWVAREYLQDDPVTDPTWERYYVNYPGGANIRSADHINVPPELDNRYANPLALDGFGLNYRDEVWIDLDTVSLTKFVPVKPGSLPFVPTSKPAYVSLTVVQATLPPIITTVPPAPLPAPKSHNSLLGAHYLPGGNWLLGDMADMVSAGKPVAGVTIQRVGDTSDLTPSQVKSVSPSTVVVERWAPGNYDIAHDLDLAGFKLDWALADLYACGRQAVQIYRSKFPLDPKADYQCILNEPPPIKNRHGFVTFWNGALDEAESAGLHLTVGNFAYYHPALLGEAGKDGVHRDSDGEDCQLLTDPDFIILVRRMILKGHALTMDEYIDPDWLPVGGDWTKTGPWDGGTMARHEAVIKALPANCQSVKVILKEDGTGYAHELGADLLTKYWGIRDKFLHTGIANVLYAGMWSAAPWASEPRSDWGPYRTAVKAYWRSARF